MLSIERIDSPLGTLTIVSDADVLVALEFEENEERLRSHLLRRFRPRDFLHPTSPGGVAAAIQAYFAGDLSAIESIPVDLAGTSFERQVYSELRRIPRGTTIPNGMRIPRRSSPTRNCLKTRGAPVSGFRQRFARSSS